MTTPFIFNLMIVIWYSMAFWNITPRSRERPSKFLNDATTSFIIASMYQHMLIKSELTQIIAHITTDAPPHSKTNVKE